MGTTFDVETDVLDKLSALLPTDVVLVTVGGTTKNAWTGPLRPVTVGAMPLKAIFCQLYGGDRDHHSDGAIRRFEVQITVRNHRNDYEEAWEIAHRIHDALDLLGPWQAPTSLRRYMDCRSKGAGPIYVGPDDNDAELFVESFEIWYDG